MDRKGVDRNGLEYDKRALCRKSSRRDFVRIYEIVGAD